MPMLMAVCPRCRIETNTGLSADDPTVPPLGPTLEVLVLCDDCSKYQHMLVEQLQLAAEEVVA